MYDVKHGQDQLTRGKFLKLFVSGFYLCVFVYVCMGSCVFVAWVPKYVVYVVCV